VNGDNEVPLSDINPSWMEDGYGIEGPPSYGAQDDSPDWDTRVWSDSPKEADDVWSDQNQDSMDLVGTPSTCLTDAGDPPGSGTWILGSIDGMCQWIDSTTCA
jgi:hypothetical protein